ncbi:MAG: hypothetical protein ABSB86_14430, partial [Bryobacteraceae bacterium]
MLRKVNGKTKQHGNGGAAVLDYALEERAGGARTPPPAAAHQLDGTTEAFLELTADYAHRIATG